MINDQRIDWARIAKPQPDAYDSAVLGRSLADRWRWTKGVPGPGAVTLVNGHVTVTADPYRYTAKNMADTTVTRAELDEIDRHLAAWPDGYANMGLFLDEFWPKRSPRGFGTGSCSSHRPLNASTRITNVYVTVDNPQGCAEGIYHEVGHLRLEALGLNINDHDGRLITNVIDALYDSPIRRDKQRPMCAVMHGLYAWMMLSENDLWCAAGLSPELSRQYLSVNVPKIAKGIAEVERYAQPTRIGEPFLAGMMAWAKDIVARGTEVIARR